MGWELFGWSFSVIWKHKQLILFPMFSAVAAAVGMGLWFLQLRGVSHPGWEDYALLAPAYLIVTFVMVFFNCALAACAQAYFSGGEPTLGYGIAHAAARVAPIFGWAVVSTTVGILLNAIERRAAWAAKIAIWLFGFAWGMTTYLVVPVLIAEDRGAVGSVRRSAQLMRDTWGDQLVAEIRFGWRGLLVFLPAVILGAIGANGYPPFLLLAAAWFAIGAAAISAAKGVFEVALYRYAALGETPAGWSPDVLPGLFQRR